MTIDRIRSVLIKDTTREERIRIVNRSLAVCGTECEFCSGCDKAGSFVAVVVSRPITSPISTEKRSCARSTMNFVQVWCEDKQINGMGDLNVYEVACVYLPPV